MIIPEAALSTIVISTKILEEPPVGTALWVVEKTDIGSEQYRYFTNLPSALDLHREWLECSLTSIYGVTHVSLYLVLVSLADDSRDILLKPLMVGPQGESDPLVDEEHESSPSGEVVGWGVSGGRFLEYKGMPEGRLALVSSTDATEAAYFREQGSKVLELRQQTSDYPRARLDVAVGNAKLIEGVDTAVGVPWTNRSTGNHLKSCVLCISTYFLADIDVMEAVIWKIKTLGEVKVVYNIYDSDVEACVTLGSAGSERRAD